ncbi:hypothetical protein [Marinobacterium weihaiense]|uniref:Toxin CptA n=1 Tax=Marinobacterium weihaiense TaxID=2851016 RepID=A0ABS6MCI6_9GAMM|nr:hypothetical protein [Marinobacterium weihaiense]MBV0933551.1 hypothetical protein [Marinobacterium weihaiense]
MNAFSPIEVHVRSGDRPLRILYLLTFSIGILALAGMPMESDRKWLSLISYVMTGGLICRLQLRKCREDRIMSLNWDVEHRMMSVLTGSGQWVPVDEICRSLSIPGIVQLLVVQRRDRGLPCWLWLTPYCLSPDSARRLHVAITLAAPLAPPPATEN